jgi:hypothetical protein
LDLGEKITCDSKKPFGKMIISVTLVWLETTVSYPIAEVTLIFMVKNHIWLNKVAGQIFEP